MWGGFAGNSYGGMDGMMGGNGVSTPSYLWIIPVTLIALSAFAIIGFAFYWAFPELRYIKGSCGTANVEQLARPQEMKTIESASAQTPAVSTVSPVSPASNNCNVLLKSMTPEEQKVLNALVSHQGKYLQKYIAKETGLTRLKTHRIVARFAQRGIVSVKEFGNTNEIVLSDWVKGSKIPESTAS